MARLILIAALAFASILMAGEDYKFTADSEERPNIPHGVVTEYKFNESKLFPGTARSYWIYLPPNFNKETAYPFMVFFDGGGAVQPKGGFRVPVVFDNLIADKSIPPLVGIFINPGSIPPIAPGATGRSTRSYEYDTPTDLNARFVIEEIIPLVAKQAKLSDKPEDHAVWGISSGGIAAFTAAWFRPDYFRKVISYIGSYTNIQGGYWYPSAIRKTERKPFRIFLQEGSNDLDNVHGNWPLSNQEMANALKFAGYDYKFTMGDGGHSGKQGGAILPEALRWLWRPAEPLPNPTPEVPNDMALSGILIPGEGWQLVVERKTCIGAMCSDAEGNLYFGVTNTDPNPPGGAPFAGGEKVSTRKDEGLYKLDVAGKITPFNPNADGVTHMAFGKDGKLIALIGGKNRLVAFDKDGKEDVLAENVPACCDFVVNHRGHVYLADYRNGAIQLWEGPGKMRELVKDFPGVHSLALTPNQETLAAVELSGPTAVWAFRVEASGDLGPRMPVMPYPHFEWEQRNEGWSVLCDTRARFYCSAHNGIQTYDTNGRPIGTILSPTQRPLMQLILSGPDMNWLFASSDGKIFKRKVNAKGFLTSGLPILGEVKKK